MNESTIFRSPPGTRQQPLLRGRVKEKQRFAAVAGGTAADCAAICCCFPCGVMNLLILTIYKVPVGICKKVWNKQREKRKKNPAVTAAATAETAAGAVIEWPINGGRTGEPPLPSSYLPSEDMELEEAMWDRIYGTGFWRTPSQREA